jgi:hypothetical protein
VSLGTFLEYSL